MSKEYLEEMNNKVTGLTDSDGDFADVVKMDVDVYAWFYKQAERVQELEKRLKIYQKRSWFEDYEKVAKQNKRYREAIEKARRELETCARSAYFTLSKTLEGESQ